MLIKDLLIKNEEEKVKTGTTPYIEIGDIDTVTKKYYKKEKGSVSGAKYAYKNSILVSTVRPTRGAISIVTDEKIAVSSAFAILNVDEMKCNHRYLFYYINKDIFFKYLGKRSKGATYPTCSKEAIYNYEIELPSMEVQNKIVEILDYINNLILIKQDQINKCNLMINSQFIEMFGDPIINSKKLELKKLLEISFNKSGKAIVTGELESECKAGYYPCYGGNGIRGYINRKNHSGCLPIIGRQGALAGNVNLACGDFYATEHAVVATPIIDVNPIWYYYALKMFDISRFQTGAAQPGLTIDIINNLKLPFPNFNEQNKFALFVEHTDKQRYEFEKQLEKLNELRASLMQEYFS